MGYTRANLKNVRFFLIKVCFFSLFEEKVVQDELVRWYDLNFEATFLTNIEKNVQKKTHLFQIYEGVPPKKRCVFFSGGAFVF